MPRNRIFNRANPQDDEEEVGGFAGVPSFGGGRKDEEAGGMAGVAPGPIDETVSGELSENIDPDGDQLANTSDGGTAGGGGEIIEEPDLTTEDTRTQDERIEEGKGNFIEGGFEGPRDTAEDQRLARESIMDDLGASLVDQRARMGRSGMSSSGAMAGLESDARRLAGRDLAETVLGIEQGARDEAFDRGESVFGLDIAGQESAARLAQNEAAIEMWRAIMNGPDGVKGDTNNDGSIDRGENVALGEDLAQRQSEAQRVDSPPPGATPVDNVPGAMPGEEWYVDAEGNFYVVAPGGREGDLTGQIPQGG